jgi:hypothetical protein
LIEDINDTIDKMSANDFSELLGSWNLTQKKFYVEETSAKIRSIREKTIMLRDEAEKDLKPDTDLIVPASWDGDEAYIEGYKDGLLAAFDVFISEDTQAQTRLAQAVTAYKTFGAEFDKYQQRTEELEKRVDLARIKLFKSRATNGN